MSRTTYFVDVVLPLAVPNLYTYRVPYDWNDIIEVGKRVVVQFGRGKLYSALVRTIHEIPPKQYEAKYIDSILDEHPIVNLKQFALWDWMSQYYMCHIGDVMVAALPGGLRLASETKIVLNPEYKKQEITNWDEERIGTKGEQQTINSEIDSKKQQATFSDKEHLIIEALEVRTVLSINEVSEILEQKTVYPILKKLIEKGVVLIHEELKEKFKPKIESFVRITEYANNEENLKAIFPLLEKKAPKQLDVLIAYIKLSERYSQITANNLPISSSHKEVKKSEIIKMISGAEAALKSLVQKNIFEIYEREVGRFASYDSANKISQLNDVQQQVYESIQEQFGWKRVESSKLKVESSIVASESPSTINQQPSTTAKDVVLLHGVTSSGKTEIYVKLIEQAIAQGKQVLYLLPEIALTTQIINRLRKYFGDAVGVYHSKFNGNERVEVWNNVLNARLDSSKLESSKLESSSSEPVTTLNSKLSNFKLIVGARSSLFLPFSNLGLVIVDEEHDTSYKQYDPAPRYNARDGAIYLAHIHKAKTLLGSATPSIESYYNAQEGKYGFAEITQRFGGVQMPEILIADVKEATRKKLMKSHF